jgi:hypothetical protein
MKDAAAPGLPLDPSAPLTIALLAVTGAHIAEGGADMPASLPRDHPAWQRDVLAVSARVRAVIASLRPAAVRVLTFWDHAVRCVAIGGRRIDVDPSGSYRLR